jgi:hypothetical protein
MNNPEVSVDFLVFPPAHTCDRETWAIAEHKVARNNLNQ